MTKNGLMLVSLVGAIPGLGLVFLMAMAFMNHAAGPAIWSKALAGMSLLVGLLLAAMPLIIFVRGGPAVEKPVEKKKDEDEAEVVDAADAETIIAESDDDAEASAAVTDESLEVVEGEPDEFAMTGEVVTGDSDAGSSEEFDADSDFEIGGDSGEAVEVIDEGDEFEEEVEEEAPKKKK